MIDRKRNDHTLLVFLAAIFLFNSPLTNWWAVIGLPWYAMFGGWALIILLAAINHSRRHDGD